MGDRSIEQYSIASDAVELCAINFGGIISSLRVPDRDGNFGDVVLGHARLEPYLENPAYLGAVIGRYANRIADGRFRLDGVSHQLTTNEMKNHLHGGTCGFDQRIWTATLLTSPAVGVRFTRTSHAGEEGYPGTLRVSTTYCVTSSGTIVLQYDAFTDAPTIVNLTQHTYFNLTAQPNASVLDHELRIYSEDYIPVGVTRVPTGEVAGVQGTPFNFRTPTRIAAALAMEHDQLRVAGGLRSHVRNLTSPNESRDRGAP